MNQTTSIADGNVPSVKAAAQDANAVQDAVNLIAIVGCFHRHLMALRQTGLVRRRSQQSSRLTRICEQAQQLVSDDH